MGTDRAKHIDIAKGISITLVVLLHSQLAPYIYFITEPLSLVRMPLFFFLSGFFFQLH
ncbi:acyltransferase family protein [Alteromonas mediterranea]|uniref:acyltransferase family protein n=1 Tax=Alteromonas mediterranea TaxID=314275 RepID=UPI0009BF2F46